MPVIPQETGIMGDSHQNPGTTIVGSHCQQWPELSLPVRYNSVVGVPDDRNKDSFTGHYIYMPASKKCMEVDTQQQQKGSLKPLAHSVQQGVHYIQCDSFQQEQTVGMQSMEVRKMIKNGCQYPLAGDRQSRSYFKSESLRTNPKACWYTAVVYQPLFISRVRSV